MFSRSPNIILGVLEYHRLIMFLTPEESHSAVTNLLNGNSITPTEVKSNEKTQKNFLDNNGKI